MARNTGGDQHLQKITLSKVPVPDKDIACQNLLKQDISWKGWLKRKKPWNLGRLDKILFSSMTWEQKFVIISKGCMYFYGKENDKKPEKAFSLFGYTRVMRAIELRAERDGLWPFKVAYVLDEKDRVHYFSAACQKDMMDWLKHVKKELYKANGVELPDEDIDDEDIHDLETPISTGNYFGKIENLNKIKQQVKNDDDSDMDSDYDYIDPEDHPVKPPANSGKTFVKKPEAEASKSKPSAASSPSLGYYPPFVNPGTSTKPLPQLPMSPNTPSKPVTQPKQDISKRPPATPVKPKRMGGSDSTQIECILKGQEAASPKDKASLGSVANLREGLFGGQASKPCTPAKTSEQSSSSKTTKPLPAVPLAARISNAPTAVVSPVRQPATATPSVGSASSRNQYNADLEGPALWTQSPGEGQRLLVSLDQEGVYMLRSCTDGSCSLTLLVIAEYQLRKYKIFQNEQGMVSLQTDFNPGFDSVHNLLNYYRSNNLPMRQTKLFQPYSALKNR